MLTVKTKIGPSELHGIGLFAEQDIPEGMVVWEFSYLVDRVYIPLEIDAMPMLAKKQLMHYGYKTEHGSYVMCGDDARFFNHSLDANCFEVYSPEGTAPTIAERDIKQGEELTINYCQFDVGWAEKHIILTQEEKKTLEAKGLLLDTKRRIFPRLVKGVCIKRVAEKTIKRDTLMKSLENLNKPTADILPPEGDLIYTTESLDYPTDGPNSTIEIDKQRFGVNKIEFEVKPGLQQYK